MNAAPGNNYQRVGGPSPPANRTALGLGTWWVSGPGRLVPSFCSFWKVPPVNTNRGHPKSVSPEPELPSDLLWGWGRVEGGAAAQKRCCRGLWVPAHLAV